MRPEVVSIIALAALFLFFLFMYVTELLNRRTADRNFEALEEESGNRRTQIANLKNELSHAKDKLAEEVGNSEALAKNLQDEQTEVRKLKTTENELNSEIKHCHTIIDEKNSELAFLKEQYRIKDEYSQSEFAEQLLFLGGDIPFMVKEIQNNEEYLEQCKQEIPEKFRTTRTGNPRALHMGMRMALKDTKKKLA